jgi:hypothetical protein
MTPNFPTVPTIPVEGIKKTQIASRAGCTFLWEHRADLPAAINAQVDYLWKHKKKGAVRLENEVVYKLAKTLPAKLGYGRLFGSCGALERMEKECRGTLCQAYYHDIDIANCHPVLLHQFAKRYFDKDLVEVEKYCMNREKYLAQICPDRDEAKEAIIKIMYGGKNEHVFLGPFAEEIKSFTKYLFGRDEYADLAEACRKHKELREENKKFQTGIYGTFLSYILQTEERRCMLAMADAFEMLGWKVDVFCYDGIMVRKNNQLDLEVALVVAMSAIKTTVGYDVSIIDKPFMTFKDFVDEMANVDEADLYMGVKKSLYLEMKREFEETNFYYAPTDEYYEYIEGKDPIVMKGGHASTYYSTKWIFRVSAKIDDYKQFFPMWMADPTRRVIKSLTMKPSTEPEVFTIPIRLQYQNNLDETDLENGPAKFLELLDLTCSNNDILKTYTLNWLSHLLQKPFDLPGTSLIFTGDKGVGKDTLWDFFMTHVIGPVYSHNYTDTKTFFEKHDCNFMNKFLVKLEEADAKVCLENASLLKGRITGNYNTFNPKNSKTVKADNFARVVMTTNGTCPVDMSSGERRFVVIPCSIAKKGDNKYWSDLRAEMFNDKYGGKVAAFLMARDITEFVVQKLPENDYQDAVVDSRKSSEERFMETWIGAECSASQLFTQYKTFCIDNKLEYNRSNVAFSKAILKFARSVLLIKRTSKGMRYSRIGYTGPAYEEAEEEAVPV